MRARPWRRKERSMDVTVARYLGLGAMVVLFVITILLMPKIFGITPTSEDDR